MPTGLGNDASGDGASSIGAWEATGPNAFTLTFDALAVTEEGLVVTLTIRAAGEVSEDGQRLDRRLHPELTGEGASPGEYGAGT